MKRLLSSSPQPQSQTPGVPEFAGTARAGASVPPLSGPLPAVRWSGLDGLRALAVAAVLIYHFFPAVLPGGYIGVDVFFVISGFLITSLLLGEQERSGRISLTRFWTRRVRRLIPPLVPVLLVSASAALLVGGDVLVSLGRQIFGAITFSYNWVSIGANASYFTADQPELFRNLWSLAVEEQFYLVWPLALGALLLIPRPRLRLSLVLALAGASAVWMAVLYRPGADPTRVYFGSDTHSFGLAIGAALALMLWRRDRVSSTLPDASARQHTDSELPRLRPWLGVGALLGLAAASVAMPADSPLAYRGGLLAVSILSAVAIWAGVRSGRFGRCLDARALRALGARSYGIYLWHWPILILLQLTWPATRHATASAAGWRTLVIGVGALVLTLLASEASFRWLEQPIRRLGFGGSIRRVKARLHGTRVQRQTVLAVMAGALLLVAGTTVALTSAPTIASAEAVIERGQRAMDAAASAAQAGAPTASGTATAAPAPQSRVVIPFLADEDEAAAVPAGERISAVGDSVMLASAPELQEAFPGIAIDAAVSRGMRAAPDILDTLAQTGQLRDVVVIGLGTNGPIDDSDLERIQVAIGPNRQLVVVNAFAERDWTPGVNATLADFAAHHRRIELADWSSAIAPHTDVLAEDNIHPGPTGGRIYAETVSSAVARLAALPPAQQPGPNRLLLLPD